MFSLVNKYNTLNNLPSSSSSTSKKETLYKIFITKHNGTNYNCKKYFFIDERQKTRVKLP